MRIAAQLYTLRDFTTTRADFVDALCRVKAIGYEEVQLSAVGCMNGPSPEVSAADCRDILGEVGLKAPLTHRGWDEIKDRTDECIAFHKTIGAELVAVGSIPGEYRAEGLDGYRRFVDDAEPAIERLYNSDLKFAYHNHAFEFELLGPKQEQPFRVMLERGTEEFLFEIDTYWVVHAGVDLIDLVECLHDRMPMVHLKDKAVFGNESRMAPVGEGNLSWNRVLLALEEAGTYLGAVEQDECYGRDPFDCLASSLRFLGR
ncbi:MAG: sugar phosphate isomerase/epimerase [Chlorobia bacterium]|nr:sugar phosphate isomerase/epimerase [Fimbriimonadaceae bacterium]